jgi:hypothetical protein
VPGGDGAEASYEPFCAAFTRTSIDSGQRSVRFPLTHLSDAAGSAAPRYDSRSTATRPLSPISIPEREEEGKGMRAFIVEAKSLESARALSHALSDFQADMSESEGDGYRVTVELGTTITACWQCWTRCRSS